MPATNLDSSTSERANKIAKLLRKAESTDNEHERLSLVEAAERLMIRWGIEDAVLRSAQRDHDKASSTTTQERKLAEVVERPLMYSGRWARAYAEIAMAVANGLHLRPFYTQPSIWPNDPSLGSKAGTPVRTHGSCVIVYLVGFEDDVNRGIALAQSLTKQAQFALNAWWADTIRRAEEEDYVLALQLKVSTPHEKFISQREFMYQFGYAAAHRIELLYSDIRNQMAQQGTSTELALLDQDALLDKYISESHPDLDYSQRRRSSSNLGNSIDSGREAGRRADIGQQSMTDQGTRRQLPS